MRTKRTALGSGSSLCLRSHGVRGNQTLAGLSTPTNVLQAPNSCRAASQRSLTSSGWAAWPDDPNPTSGYNEQENDFITKRKSTQGSAVCLGALWSSAADGTTLGNSRSCCKPGSIRCFQCQAVLERLPQAGTCTGNAAQK